MSDKNIGHGEQLSPNQALNLAREFKAGRDLIRAENICRQILKTAPEYHPAYHELGLLAVDKGQLSHATQLVSQAIALNERIYVYHRNLCELYRRLGSLEKAVAAGQRATSLKEDDLDAHYNLGLALADSGLMQEAADSYHRALALNPKHGLSWNNLGAALEKLGNESAAEEAYSRAVQLDQRHHEAQNNLGAIYSVQGKLDEARTCFEKAIEATPGFISPHYNLSSLKVYDKDDPHLKLLEEMALTIGANQSLDERIRLSFALGKAREDAGNHDTAFVAYENGNRLKHNRLSMDERKADGNLAKIMEVFDQPFFEARTKPALSDRTPVFIVGLPRSGTTLIEQILASHPEVYGGGELSQLREVLAKPSGVTADRTFIEYVRDLSTLEFETLGHEYLERVWALSPESRFITDKMPANYFFIGMIHLIFPDAKIIHSVRDPIDSCFSCYARLFNETMEFAYDLGTLGRYAARYLRLMWHWHNVLPTDTVLDVRYEDIVDDVEGQARRMLDYIGLPWSDECLKFYENKRPVKTASIAQVRKPIYRSSVGRAKNFEKHLTLLRDIIDAYYDKAARSLVRSSRSELPAQVK